MVSRRWRGGRWIEVGKVGWGRRGGWGRSRSRGRSGGGGGRMRWGWWLGLGGVKC